MRRLEIAIAGAGPGGLAAALALHRLGHRIVIYEQFEKARPLGSGLILQPTGLAVLDWLDLGDRIRTLGARIDRLHGKDSMSGRTVLDVRYAALGSERGVAVHRAALFNVLHDAVSAEGIPIETSSQINGFDSGVLTLGKDRRTPRYDLVVDALGMRSPLARFTHSRPEPKPLSYGALWASLPWPGAGFDPHALEQRYRKASVMIGVLPIGRVREGKSEEAAFFWSIKAEDMAVWRTRGLEAWKDDVLRHWPACEPLLASIVTEEQLTFARYQHHTNSSPYADRVISIGDSAHATSPQLGQGANMALLDVKALAGAMEKQKHLFDVAQDYVARRGLHVRVYQLLSRLFTPFYQSDSAYLPLFRDYLAAPLSRIPPVQRFLARMVAGTFVTPIRKGLTVRKGDAGDAGSSNTVIGWPASHADGDGSGGGSDGGDGGGGGD